MKILIIGEDKALAHAINHEMEEAQCKIRYAATGELGLKIAREKQFDLIVLDWSFPKEGDLKVLLELGTQINLSPILMLVADDSVRDVILSLHSCPYICMTKPKEIQLLTARIKALIPRSKWDRSKKHLPSHININLTFAPLEINDSSILPNNADEPMLESFDHRHCMRKHRVGDLWECLVEEPVRCPNLISYGSEKYCIGEDYLNLMVRSGRLDDSQLH